MNKIFCFGDGFAANHIWPEWPAIVSALYPNIKHENFGAIGAGNEFISSAIIQAHKKDPDAFFIVQWAEFKRFDKLLQDDSWDEIIKTDPTYYFNTVMLGQQKWWISSNSKQESVQKYHQFYVQSQQAKLRTDNYMYLISNLLKDHAIFFSTHDINIYSMHTRFAGTRQKEIQPAPWIHMCFVEEIILPKMPFLPCPKRLAMLKDLIQQQSWEAYHWDRDKIWNDIVNSLN